MSFTSLEEKKYFTSRRWAAEVIGLLLFGGKDNVDIMFPSYILRIQKDE